MNISIPATIKEAVKGNHVAHCQSEDKTRTIALRPNVDGTFNIDFSDSARGGKKRIPTEYNKTKRQAYKIMGNFLIWEHLKMKTYLENRSIKYIRHLTPFSKNPIWTGTVNTPNNVREFTARDYKLCNVVKEIESWMEAHPAITPNNSVKGNSIVKLSARKHFEKYGHNNH
jgi:hypothetical protein